MLTRKIPPASITGLQDILLAIGPHNSILSNLDLVSGYCQFTLTEESKQLTAFSTTSGHFAYKCNY